MFDKADLGKIIDTHAHIGSWCADNVDFTEETILDAVCDPLEIDINGETEKNVVEYVLVSNMSGIDLKEDDSPKIDEMEANEEMLDVCQEHPILKALIVGQPGYGDAQNLVDIIERRGDEVFGIKLHPNTLHLNANDELYEPYMQVAQEYHLPVLFHSQDDYSDPLYIYETALKFPDVPVIMAHLGMGDDQNHWYAFGILQAAIKADNCNLYADVSWLSPEMIVALLIRGEPETIDKLLFGTDIPLGPYSNPATYPARISEVKSAIYAAFPEEDAEILCHKLFFQNAWDLFFDGRL